MTYTWERREIAGFDQIAVFEHGEGYVDELGSIYTNRDKYLFVFLSPWKAIMHGNGGFSCAAFAGVQGGAQQFSFPLDCASTDKEIAEFTIKCLEAGKRKFDNLPTPSS